MFFNYCSRFSAGSPALFRIGMQTCISKETGSAFDLERFPTNEIKYSQIFFPSTNNTHKQTNKPVNQQTDKNQPFNKEFPLLRHAIKSYPGVSL